MRISFYQRLRFLPFVLGVVRLIWAACAAHRFAPRTALAPRATTLKVVTLTRGVCEPAKSLALRKAQRGAKSALMVPTAAWVTSRITQNHGAASVQFVQPEAPSLCSSNTRYSTPCQLMAGVFLTERRMP